MQDDLGLVAGIATTLEARIALERDRRVLGEVEGGLLASMIAKAIHLGNHRPIANLRDSKVPREGLLPQRRMRCWKCPGRHLAAMLSKVFLRLLSFEILDFRT